MRRWWSWLLVGLVGVGVPARSVNAQGALAPAGLPRLSHGDHRNVPCASCHQSRERHGQLVISTVADCQACHHTGEARNDCSTCHRQVRAPLTHEVAFSRPSRPSQTRNLRFAHASHTTVRCDRCHAPSADHTARAVDCTSCHDAHHTSPTANCSSCHAAANALATHKLADHASCSSAGCHGAKAARLPDTRATCLVCHQQQVAHKPGGSCSTCHQVRIG